MWIFPNPAEELVDVLPMLGIEVEENDDSGTKSLENVVVGEVLEKSQHPEADRLSVCSVEVGAENPCSNRMWCHKFQNPVTVYRWHSPEPSYRVGLRSRNQNFGE